MTNTFNSMKKIIILFVSVAVIFTSFALLKAEDQNVVSESVDTSIDQEQYTAIDEEGNITFYTAKDVMNETEHKNGLDIVNVDEDGNEEILMNVDTLEEAESLLESSKEISTLSDDDSTVLIKEADSSDMTQYYRSARATNEYVVKLKQNLYDNGNAKYATVINTANNQSVGISWASSWDAAYIRTEGNYYIIKISNMIAKISKDDAELVSYNDNLCVNYYQVSNGRFGHYISTNATNYANFLQVGYQPSYINANTKYYSYDGKYFYTDYTQMLADYRNGTTSHAVNNGQPYYNYFQYLSHKTTTNFSGAQIDAYVKASKPDNYANSKLYGMGSSFIEMQNTYGANAILMFGVAVNESGWGLSSISQSKNNLFGHNAYDSDPSGGANGYSSPAVSIKVHATDYVCKYANPGDWRYNGPILGTKSSGMNVRYATDQYWGEKAAAQAYGLENHYKNQNIDYGYYTLGIVDGGDVGIYKDANQNTKLYGTGNNAHAVYDYSVTILGKVTGQSINGNNIWYKVVTDIALKSDRSAIANSSSGYDINRDYGYIHSSQVNVVFESNNVFSKFGLKESNSNVSGFTLDTSVSDVKMLLSSNPEVGLVDFKNAKGQSITSGKIATGMTFTLSIDGVNKKYSVVVRGDTNGDGEILANDYFIIKKYKEGGYSLSDAYLKAADVNNDGQVLANDYFMVKKYKEGQYSIAQ